MTGATNLHEAIEANNLSVLGRELLAEALASQHAARAARTIISRHGLRATLIALRNGHELAQHDSPGAATIFVVEGQVVLRAANRDWPLSINDVMAVPPQRHSVRADTDAVILLTVRLD